MKEKITQSLVLFFLIVVGAGITFAQRPQHVASESSTTTAFSKLRKHANQNTQKVAVHDDLPSAELDFEWNGADWDSLRQFVFLYNPNGSLASYQRDFFNGSMFLPEARINYTYDTNGNEIEYIREAWTGTAWENSARATSTYDAQGNETSYIYDVWANGAWSINSGDRYTLQYNGGNQIIEEISEYYYSGTSSWEMAEKANYQYTAGEWSEVVYSSWDGTAWQLSGRLTGLSWYNFEKQYPATVTFQTYSNGNYFDSDRSTCTYRQFDSQECISETYTTMWENAYKEIYNRDQHDHEIYNETYSWSGSWNFDGGFRSNYTYDAQARTLEIIYQEQLSPTTAENDYKQVFSSFFTGAASALEANVEVTAFPNPVTAQLNFDLKLEKHGPVTIALLDIQGRKRLETHSNYNGNTISIPIASSLENGVYFYQVKMGDAFAKGSIVIAN